MMGEDRTTIITDDGRIVNALQPIILSVSRSTDIPAYYSEWFFERLKKGYIRWINPFNNRSYYVSLKCVKFIVFWTKNPDNIFDKLSFLDDSGIKYYFLVTINNYENEGFEPGIPDLNSRLHSFRTLSEKIGSNRVIWRFDPILKSDTTDTREILERIKYIGDFLHPYTNKLVFSFIDTTYKKVIRQISGQNITQFSDEEKRMIISGLIKFNMDWNLTLASCADISDYSDDIIHNSCIDSFLIRKLCSDDPEMIRYLDKNSRKDPGQRPACRCIKSKDIGQYDTCPAGCIYCYASNHEKAKMNYALCKISLYSDSIINDGTGTSDQYPVA